MPTLQRTVQSLNPGERVSLYMLDMTALGGDQLFFCDGKVNADGTSGGGSQGLTFGGVYYTPIDIDFSGMEVSGVGALPRPKVRISNSNAVFQGFVNEFGDLVGCPFSRVRTFRKFLDDGDSPDPGAYFGPDKFRVDQKVDENPVYIEWDLSSSIDNVGKQLPGRVMLRDQCLWRYRRWTGTEFDYTRVQCPYVGVRYFDVNNNRVSPDKDACSRDLTGCQFRFGVGNPLPFGGFPGMARVHP